MRGLASSLFSKAGVSCIKYLDESRISSSDPGHMFDRQCPKGTIRVDMRGHMVDNNPFGKSVVSTWRGLCKEAILHTVYSIQVIASQAE